MTFGKTLTTILVLFALAGCAKKTAATLPPPPGPGPDTTVQQPVTTAAKPPANRPSQASNQTPAAKPTQMTKEETAQLNASLGRIEDALFDYDRATIRPDAAKALESDVSLIRGLLQKYPSTTLKLEGHADQRGTAEYNLALGDRRAESVKQFLASMGVPSGQLSTVSYGKERPLCTDEDEACWQKNRRVHIATNTP